MLESVPVNLWSTDAQLNITFSQGAGLHLIGDSANEQVGMTLYEVLKTRDPRFTPLAAHLRALQGELVRYETDWRGRSFETRVEPLRAADGKISGTVGIAIDVTDRKSLYEALQTQNVYFATLFENAPGAIAILDEHDHIIRINGQFTSMFGYTEDESVGQNINDLIVPAGAGGGRGRPHRARGCRREADGPRRSETPQGWAVVLGSDRRDAVRRRRPARPRLRDVPRHLRAEARGGRSQGAAARRRADRACRTAARSSRCPSRRSSWRCAWSATC